MLLSSTMNPLSDGRFSPPNKERALEEKCQSHPDANVDETVEVAAFVWSLHQGQICMSTSRRIVEKPIAKEFTEKFIKKVST